MIGRLNHVAIAVPALDAATALKRAARSELNPVWGKKPARRAASIER